MLNIIFQNQHFCIIRKPSGFLSVPSRQGLSDKRPVAGIVLEKQLNQRVWPCHRLDFEVSGLLMFALNASAHRTASGWFENHLVKKTYDAIALENSHFRLGVTETWTCKLVRGKKRAFEADYGKEAVTIATPIEKIILNNKEYVRWRLEPQTGRSHQLRYEMYRHHIPIVGDHLYGSTSEFEMDAIALTAVALDFLAIAKGSRLGLEERVTTWTEEWSS